MALFCLLNLHTPVYYYIFALCVCELNHCKNTLIFNIIFCPVGCRHTRETYTNVPRRAKHPSCNIRRIETVSRLFILWSATGFAGQWTTRIVSWLVAMVIKIVNKSNWLFATNKCSNNGLNVFKCVIFVIN